jgi:hypothetical protein
MVISTYQVNNVLRVYGDQLRQNRLSNKAKTGGNPAPDRLDISTGAKRKAVIEKVASAVIERIVKYGPQDEMEKEVFKKLEDSYGAPLVIDQGQPEDLLFKVIDEEGETINALSIEDSSFLTHKLMEITRETVDRNMI